MGTQLVDKLEEKINSSSWLIAKSRGEEVKVKGGSESVSSERGCSHAWGG